MKTLVLSDTHIGDPRFDHDKVIKLLEKEGFDQLVLNGDFVDLWAVSCSNALKDKFFKYVIGLADKKKVVWVKGNHDHDFPTNLIDEKILVTNSYMIEENNKKILLIHGNQIYWHKDKSFINKLCTKLNILLYRWFKWDLQEYINTSKYYKKTVHKKREKVLDKYHDRADIIIMGHTHRIGFASKYQTALYDVGSIVITRSYAIIENGVVSIRIRS